jgi:hypothetical protein
MLGFSFLLRTPSSTAFWGCNSTYFGEGPTSRFHLNLPPESACFVLEQGGMQNYWVPGLRPSSGISKYKKTERFGNCDQFPSSGEGGKAHTLLSPLERAGLNHWTVFPLPSPAHLRTETDPVPETLCLHVRIKNSERWRKSRNPVILSVIHHRQNLSVSARRRYVSPKRQYPSDMHGVTTQKTFTAVRPSSTASMLTLSLVFGSPCREYNWGATCKKSSGSCLKSREYDRKDPSRWPRCTLYPQKLALTSPTSGGRSVGIVFSRTQATEFSFCLACLEMDAMFSSERWASPSSKCMPLEPTRLPPTVRAVLTQLYAEDKETQMAWSSGLVSTLTEELSVSCSGKWGKQPASRTLLCNQRWWTAAKCSTLRDDSAALSKSPQVSLNYYATSRKAAGS